MLPFDKSLDSSLSSSFTAVLAIEVVAYPNGVLWMSSLPTLVLLLIIFPSSEETVASGVRPLVSLRFRSRIRSAISWWLILQSQIS